MNLLRQLNLLLLILVMMLGTRDEAQADQEPPRALSEMDAKSSLIIDGVVTAITDLNTELINHPDGKPVVRIRRQAVFQIEKIQKGQIDSKANVVYLEYWKVTDSRYKGEVAPDLSVNERFRLYADTVEIDQSGKLHVFVHTRNAVRPEALEAHALPTPPHDRVTVTDEPPMLSNRILPSSSPKKSPEAAQIPEATKTTLAPSSNEQSASPKAWGIVVILTVVILSLLCLWIKKRR